MTAGSKSSAASSHSIGAVISWSGTPEQKEARDRFFRAYQESGFLFKRESGIEDLLKMLNEAGMKVIGLKEHFHDYTPDPVLVAEQHRTATEIQLNDRLLHLPEISEPLRPKGQARQTK